MTEGDRPPLVVVMGVSGSGKSTVAKLLAQRLRVPFEEGDDLHSAAAVAKMHAGHPLTDRDRAPWLDRVNAWLRGQAEAGGVVSCSALRRRYRDRLRRGLGRHVAFVLLDPPAAVLKHRLARRRGHFMPAKLLGSQLATLERPGRTEQALTLSGRGGPAALTEAALDWVKR